MQNRTVRKNSINANLIAFVFAVVVLRYGEPHWIQWFALFVCIVNIWAFVWSLDD